jgi:hypothetical protein
MAKTLATRRAAGELLEILAGFYRDVLHVRCAAEAGASEAPPCIHEDQFDAIRRTARRFDTETVAEIIEQISRFERLLWRNVNAKIAWDNIVVTCASGQTLRLA